MIALGTIRGVSSVRAPHGATRAWGRVLAMLGLATASIVAVAAQAQPVGQQTLGRLFFSTEERNVLEAVRQGLVDTGVMLANAGDIFVPDIEIPEISFTAQVIKKEGNTFSRGDTLAYQGLIRKHGPEGVSAEVFLDNVVLDEEQLATFRDDFGLNFRTDQDTGPLLEAQDKLFKARLRLSREAIIGDGVVENVDPGGRFIILKR